jgi:hypothetical protein
MATNLLRKTWDIVCPDAVVSERVGGVAVEQEVLKEAHILQTEQGDLVMRLVDDLWKGWVLALESRFYTMPTCWPCFLALSSRSCQQYNVRERH